tara:strand:+ start:112 stop:645 length:534 start_codon:yes stop_codon:yes gene_type:complete
MKKLLLILTQNTTMKRLLYFILIPICMTSCNNDNPKEINSIESFEKWVKYQKVFGLEKVKEIKQVYIFNEDNTFTLKNESKDGFLNGHHTGIYTIKKGKWWESGRENYYIELKYNDTKWTSDKKDLLFYSYYFKRRLVQLKGKRFIWGSKFYKNTEDVSEKDVQTCSLWESFIGYKD